MLSLPKLLADIGMKLWSESQPELNRHIVLVYEESNRGLWSLNASRGLHTTWIKGPRTEGCGINAHHVLAFDPAAEAEWEHQNVVLVHRKLDIVNGITPGVIPTTLLGSSWWGYADGVVALDDNAGNDLSTSLESFFSLETPEMKVRIRHDGVFYPLRNKKNVNV